MENRKKNFNYTGLISRSILTIIFLISGIAKLTDINGFRWELVSLKLFYWLPVQILAYAIPVFEIVMAILLITGLANRYVSIHLGIFIIMLALVSYYATYILNLDDCKCFGKIIDLNYGIWHFVLLAAIFILNIFVFFDRNRTWKLSGLTENK